MDVKQIKLLKSKKGENVISVSILFFMALLVLAVMFSPLTVFIGIGADAINDTPNGGFTAVVMYLLPLFFLLLFVVAYISSITK